MLDSFRCWGLSEPLADWESLIFVAALAPFCVVVSLKTDWTSALRSCVDGDSSVLDSFRRWGLSEPLANWESLSFAAALAPSCVASLKTDWTSALGFVKAAIRLSVDR